MQSIDDEIPDLSGPVSLGTYKFTLRGRGNKYETNRLSELQNSQEKEGENKVTEPAKTSSARLPFNPSPSTTSSSFQASQPSRSTHQNEAKLNDSILNRPDKPSPDRRGFDGSGPPQYDELDPSYSAADLPKPICSIQPDRRSSPASSQARFSFTPAQDHQSGRDSVTSETPSSRVSAQFHSSFSPEYLSSNPQLSAKFDPNRQSSQPAFRQANTSFRLEDHTSHQNYNALISTDGRSPQASRRANPSLPPPSRRLNTTQLYSEFTKSLNALIESDGRSSKAAGQASSFRSVKGSQRLASETYRNIESKADDLLETHRQSSQASSQVHRPATPEGYASPQSLPLSDTLPTASFNLETNQWDPDLPEANMSAHTPTNKSTRGCHSGQASSGKSSAQMSYPRQEMRNPYAILTTTKSGRPYTNPYMPIDPLPSTARQFVRASPSGQFNLGNKSEDAEIVERQRTTRYIDQEEARHRALEQAKYDRAKASAEDPFQDQTTVREQHGRNQPSHYTEYAAYQAAYGRLPDHVHQPALSTYTSDPNASLFVPENQQVSHAADTGASPYHGQRSAYEQQSAMNQRAQNTGSAVREQPSAYGQTNPRASVRLPAVRGTTEQQRLFLQEPKLDSLSLEDPTSNDAQDARRRPTEAGMPLAPGKVSHAVPIRDPAAYTGSGLISRRNQEALRQNLDTVVASSQEPTGSARTVMNDPHRDRRLSGRPSSAATDTTVPGSTLRAQAPSYESATAHLSLMSSGPSTSRPQEKAALGASKPLHVQPHVSNTLKGPERVTTDPEVMYLREGFRAPTIPPGFGYDAAYQTKDAGLPIEAIGAGNAFMNELVRQISPKQNSPQSPEDSTTWFRRDPRELSYAAAILPYETMNRMNAQQFPLEDRAPRTVGQLADESQDDDPTDRARQAATPRPIGHGRPAGYATPPSVHGPGRATTTQAPFSVLTDVASVEDKEGMERSGRKFLECDSHAIEAMFGGVYGNLMGGKHGPYDYMNHYCPPPAYAVDHNARNDDTFFDPQWFATAPPARVGRDPRREQGEYEDPTQGSASRRVDARGEAIRRESGGRGGSGVRAWGRN